MTKKLCKCGRIVDSACYVCDAKDRGTAKERGYDSTWDKLSVHYRTTHPVCEYCTWRYEQFGSLPINAAKEVHHILKVAEAPHLRLNIDNLLAVCTDCHEYLEDRPEIAKEVKSWSYAGNKR